MDKYVIEYNIIFKDNTEIGEEYSGEFITEDKNEADEIFENNKEDIEQYFSKAWVYDGQDWFESDVEVFYNNI